MHHLPLSMRVLPLAGSTRPALQAVAGRVLMARNPAAVARLADAIQAHRAQMQASADWVGQRGS